MNKAVEFSGKQLKVLSWWHPNSKFNKYDAIICDGAIRSGKSFSMSISFIFWSFFYFNNQSFAICGKTVSALSRNLIMPLIYYLEDIGFSCNFKISKNLVTISYRGRTNTFYLFGGKDKGSASLIQGITLAGVLLDEVALMPQSFVEQAIARCSVSRSKFWFNCNPQHPEHWFYKNWIRRYREKNVFYIHFRMIDNPSLDSKIIMRYKKLYSDSFYKRFVEGVWCAPDGLVYPMFNKNKHIINVLPNEFDKYYVSCDYGTINPTSMGLWGLSNNKWYRIKEFYHSSKTTGRIKTDQEYYKDLLSLTGDLKIEAVIVDPSATSFIQCIRAGNKFKVTTAKNDVMDGISNVANALNDNIILFSDSCKDTIREFSLYQWDTNSIKDAPKKEFDHAMDDVRYFVSTVGVKKNYVSFFAQSLSRKYKF